MANNDLSKEEVKRLIYGYKDTGVTDELYSFGVMLLSEIGQRSTQIDTKAAITLGWATAVLAFVVSTMRQANSNFYIAITFAGASYALITVVFSFAALRVYDEWAWPSDRDWLEEVALVNADELRRFHIRSIHEIRQNHKSITDRKASRLIWGQRFLVCAGTLLALEICVRTLFALCPASISLLKSIGMSINVT